MKLYNSVTIFNSEGEMKHSRLINLLIALTLSLALVVPAAAKSQYSVIPTFSILSVQKKVSVTIKTYNLPPGDSFDVLMGKMGTKGVNGIKVDTLNSGSGGSLTATFNIPSALASNYQIAIRLQSNTGSGYYAYNWFYNNKSNSSGNSGGSGGSSYKGIPSFYIMKVVKNKTVSIKTNNFPANDKFRVLMGPMGTQGINGIQVAVVKSKNGGTLNYSFNIPNSLKGSKKISIRLESIKGTGYYAYNWFYNATAKANNYPGNGYTYPTFYISKVVKNKSVTIVTRNLPPNDKFQVRMGPMGTQGVNGYIVGNFKSGNGGQKTLSFTIPSQLKGHKQIAIRIQSIKGTGYYAYNWFYNSTTK